MAGACPRPHISPWGGVGHETSALENGNLTHVIAYRPNGSLQEIVPIGPRERHQEGGGKRGIIRGFSKASQGRFRQEFGKLRRDEVERGHFVTLTIPKELAEAEGEEVAGCVKRSLERWCKRLERAWGTVCVYWKIEPHRDGVPHLHLLVLGVTDLASAEGKAWVSRAWFEVCGTGLEKHLRAGTQVQPVGSYNGAMSYASKYIGKEVDVTGYGRIWGVKGNREAFQAEVRSVICTAAMAAGFKRAMQAVRMAVARSRNKGYGSWKETARRYRRLEAFYDNAVRCYSIEAERLVAFLVGQTPREAFSLC